MAGTGGNLSQGNRFSALLNPIRDIAASWGVDVAKELSEYAESLGITVGVVPVNENDPGDEYPVPVDFAQAALLVQGSTSIYSRKVEHLYSLVYTAVSTLNQIGSKSKPSSDGAQGPAQNDADADALLDVEEIDFLTLDDDIPQADPKTITLSREHRPGLFFRDETQLPPVPSILAHSSAAGQTNTTPFKIATARTHASGALVMEGCPPLNEDLDTLPVTEGTDSEIDVTQPFEHNGAPELENDDDDDCCPKYPSDCEASGPEASHAKFPRPSVTGSQAIMETAALYGFTSSAPGRTRKRPKPLKDPFLMLDPHVACPTHDKPTRVGRTYKKPKKLRKKTANNYHAVIPSEANLEDFIVCKLPGNISVKTYISCSALQPQYASICRKRRAHQRREALQIKGSLDHEENWEELGAALESDDGVGFDADPFESNSGFEFDEDDEFEPTKEELPSPRQQLEDFANDEGSDPVRSAENDNQLGSQFAYLASSFEETCRKHLEKTAWMWEQRTTDVNLVERVEEWTLRIQPLLEEEERRPEFDISQYGQAVLSDFGEIIEDKDVEMTKISNLLQQSAKFEVCRRFLATLQLANNFAIEIIPPKGCVVEDFLVNIPSRGKENRPPAVSKSMVAADKILEPGKSRVKRLRQPGSTPKSARRQPLRPRLQLQNSTE